MRQRPLRLLLTVTLLAAVVAPAAEKVDLDAVTRIRDEGFHRSQVMSLVRHLTEVIGPRLTGSPQLREASDWARRTMEGWGMATHVEAHPFGQGWVLEHCRARLVAPEAAPLVAWPKAWTPGTDGAVRGRVVRASLATEQDLEDRRGTLRGAIVLLDEEREPEQIDQAMFHRYSEEELAARELYRIPEDRDHHDWRQKRLERWRFWPRLAQYLLDEGVLATVEVSDRDNGLVGVTGGGTEGDDDRPAGVPALVMAAESYNRLARLVDEDVPVEMELDVAASFLADEPFAGSTIADLPGTDLASQVVMAGAHLDSWHAGTGATDDAGGCAMVMEALRILRAAGLKPRRTIRVALWSGEERGFLGSAEYVRRHLATRPEPADPEQLALPRGLREPTWPITPLPEHGRLSAYFNIDYGAGKVRGVYTQENAAVVPIFAAWLEPLHDLGATTVSMASVGGTDHVPFDRVGIPAFQFIQDPLDYMTRTHHTNVDTLEHLRREDMMQGAVVLATFLWQAANRDEMLPRKPLPTKPPEASNSAGNG